MSDPTHDQAMQLAVMLHAGLPSRDAIRYFIDPSWDASAIDYFHDAWMRSKALARAVKQLQGKDFTEMSLEEALSFVRDKNYREMAYFLYSNNYAELSGAEKAKADTCRQAIEARLAGTAGKLDPINQFWEDMKAGKFNLPTPPTVTSTLAHLPAE